jgi:hypothetical protein
MNGRSLGNAVDSGLAEFVNKCTWSS